MKNNYRKILIVLLFLSPLIQLVLPATMEENITFIIYGIPIFAGDLIYYCIFPFLVLKYGIKFRFELLLLYLGFISLIITNIFAPDYQLERFVISSNFYFFGIFFLILNIKPDELLTVKYLVLSVFIFISLQVLLFSSGLYHLDTGTQTVVGNFIRRGTSAGPATFTGHILIILVALLYTFFKSDFCKYLLIAVSFVVIFYTGTRSSFYGLIFSILIFMIISNFLSKKNIVLFVLFIIFFVLSDYYLNILKGIEARNIEAEQFGGLFSGRIERFYDAYNLFYSNIKNILIGYGGAASPYYDPQFLGISPVISPHNQYLSILAENGLIGFIIYLMLTIKMVANIIRAKSLQGALLLSVFVFTFNSEVIGRTYVFSILFWILYFSVIYKNCEVGMHSTNSDSIYRSR